MGTVQHLLHRTLRESKNSSRTVKPGGPAIKTCFHPITYDWRLYTNCRPTIELCYKLCNCKFSENGDVFRGASKQFRLTSCCPIMFYGKYSIEKNVLKNINLNRVFLNERSLVLNQWIFHRLIFNTVLKKIQAM